jgi:hypothetical protein
VNVAAIEHEAPAASVIPHGFVEVMMAKSAALVPPSEMLLMFNVALPVLESVAVRLAEVTPCVVLGNARLEVSEATGAATAVPVPVRVTDWVGVAELSVTVIVAV